MTSKQANVKHGVKVLTHDNTNFHRSMLNKPFLYLHICSVIEEIKLPPCNIGLLVTKVLTLSFSH